MKKSGLQSICFVSNVSSVWRESCKLSACSELCARWSHILLTQCFHNFFLLISQLHVMRCNFFWLTRVCVCVLHNFLWEWLPASRITFSMLYDLCVCVCVARQVYRIVMRVWLHFSAEKFLLSCLISDKKTFHTFTPERVNSNQDKR